MQITENSINFCEVALGFMRLTKILKHDETSLPWNLILLVNVTLSYKTDPRRSHAGVGAVASGHDYADSLNDTSNLLR